MKLKQHIKIAISHDYNIKYGRLERNTQKSLTFLKLVNFTSTGTSHRTDVY
jgi:hypothetical protein